MSAAQSGMREVAHRIFAAEFADATYSYSDGDEERSPNYVLSPSGAQINRLFVVGVLTMAEWVNDETIRARIVDPTGPFVVYAGQYQPDERATLDELPKPSFVAITGKANTFQPEDSDQIYTSIRPEAVAAVDDGTRDRWVVSTAEMTIDRLEQLITAADTPHNPASGQAKSHEVYAPTPGYIADLYSLCLDTLRLMTGEIDSIESPALDVSTTKEPLIDLPFGNSDYEQHASAQESSHGADESSSEDDDQSPTIQEETEAVDPEELTDVLSDDERANIEEEFGTEFTTGDSFEPVNETDRQNIDDPSSKPSDSAAEEDSEEMVEEVPPSTDSSDDELTAVVVNVLHDLDTDEGVSRATILDTVADQTEADSSQIGEALQEALMQGKCYEAEDGVFRPI